MSQERINEKIEAFWDWFVEQEQTIKAFFTEEEEVDKERLVDEMDNLVLDLGRFAWRIGPEGETTYFLLISPNRDPELLKLSKRIMAAAPDLSDWNFYPAKQPRPWDWKLQLHDDWLMEHEVDASGWQYVLTERPGKQLEITFEAQNLDRFDAETQKEAVELALINLMGEEWLIRHVEKVRVQSAFEESRRAKAYSVQGLREELRKKTRLSL